MKKLKDIYYDKNDILVAIVILAFAAILILWRVNVMMDYPARAAEAAAADISVSVDGDISQLGDVTSDPGVEDGDASGLEGENGDDGDIAGGPEEPDICAVYVNYGDSTYTIASNCVTAGLIGSVEEFNELVEARGVETQLKAGNHFIPSNVTPDELIDYLIQPGM